MQLIKNTFQSIIAHQKSSNKSKLCDVEVTLQYTYGSGISGIFIGNMTTPVQASSKNPEDLIISATGFLKSGFNQIEQSQRATLIFYIKTIEAQTFATLTSYNAGIKHTIKNLIGGLSNEVLFKQMLFGDINQGVMRETGKALVSFNLISTETML